MSLFSTITIKRSIRVAFSTIYAFRFCIYSQNTPVYLALWNYNCQQCLRRRCSSSSFFIHLGEWTAVVLDRLVRGWKSRERVTRLLIKETKPIPYPRIKLGPLKHQQPNLQRVWSRQQTAKMIFLSEISLSNKMLDIFSTGNCDSSFRLSCYVDN